MAEKIFESRETLHPEETPVTVTSGGPAEVGSVEVFFSVVVPTTPQERPGDSEEFTREAFEGALDKVSRPVKGKYADVPYSSEDLIREKREETQLEDR